MEGEGRRAGRLGRDVAPPVFPFWDATSPSGGCVTRFGDFTQSVAPHAVWGLLHGRDDDPHGKDDGMAVSGMGPCGDAPAGTRDVEAADGIVGEAPRESARDADDGATAEGSHGDDRDADDGAASDVDAARVPDGDAPASHPDRAGADDGAMPRDALLRLVVAAYETRGDEEGRNGASAMRAAIDWCDGGMYDAVMFSRHVDVDGTACLVGRGAVSAMGALWDVRGGIGDMLASGEAFGDGTDGVDACPRDGIRRFQSLLVRLVGGLGESMGMLSVCADACPIPYACGGRPVLVPACRAGYDTGSWERGQYWRVVPFHVGMDGRVRRDDWLLSDGALPDGSRAFSVRSNADLGLGWSAWTEDLHVASVALGMLHDALAGRRGLLAATVEQADGGDLVGAVRHVWDWCAAYVWFID